MFKSLMLASAAALALTACSKPAATDSAAATPPATASEAAAPFNTLSEAEKAQGWKLLFDGKDTSQWRLYKGGAIEPSWGIDSAAMELLNANEEMGGADIITVDEYDNFELTIDWKIAPGGNSGILYMVKETPDASNPYMTGPEMQVLDNAGHPDGKIPTHNAGALYDMKAPPKDVTAPVGQWNHARILVDHGHIEHWLNGVKTAESSYGDDAWKKQVAASKFKEMKEFGIATKGHIALQDHGFHVWYRNIKIRIL